MSIAPSNGKTHYRFQKEKESATPLQKGQYEQKAGAELALRILTRKRLLPFVERFNPDYNAGWVHKTSVVGWGNSVVTWLKKSETYALYAAPRYLR